MHRFKRNLKYLFLRAQFWAYKEIRIPDDNIDLLECETESEIPVTSLNSIIVSNKDEKKYVYQKFSYFEPSKPYMFISFMTMNFENNYRHIDRAQNTVLMHKSDIFLYKLMN